MKARRSSSGFTLIEVLVAIGILAIVAVLAYRATAAMTDGEARLAQETRRWRTLDAIFVRLESDLREAVPRHARNGDAIEPAWSIAPADSRGDSALVFTRAGPEFSVEPGIAGQRIGYRLDGDVLQIAYWPRLDNPPDASPAVYALASGIAAFRILALASDGTLVDRWPRAGESDVPRGVKIELSLADGGRIERWFALR